MDSFPEEPMEPRETARETNNNDCLDLSPNPNSDLFGNREESEEESSSAESENDPEKEDGSDASSRDPVEPEERDNWTPVTSRRRSPSPIRWSKHIIRVRSNFFNPRSTKLFNKVTVYARDDAALADIESAMHSHDFSKIKQIQGLHATCEYSCDGNFQNYIPPIEANRYIVK